MQKKHIIYNDNTSLVTVEATVNVTVTMRVIAIIITVLQWCCQSFAAGDAREMASLVCERMHTSHAYLKCARLSSAE